MTISTIGLHYGASGNIILKYDYMETIHLIQYALLDWEANFWLEESVTKFSKYRTTVMQT